MRKISLCGEWLFKQNGTDEWLCGRVPSSQYADLLALGKIPDPFCGTNESAVQWVGESEWLYQKVFSVQTADVFAGRAELVFEALDTLAEVSLNGEIILCADNVNRRYVLDVTGKLVEGENTLSVLFHSATEYIADASRHIKVPINTNGLKGSPYLRKTQSHFGWDWGPTLVTAGMSRDVYIQFFENAKIVETRVKQSHMTDKVLLTVFAHAESFVKERIAPCKNGSVIVSITAPDGTEEMRVLPFAEKTETTFEISNPQLWWTRELSDKTEQPLYRVRVALTAEAEEFAEETVGLRTVELVRGKDSFGKQFMFKLNGVPVFVKGANFIPSDSLITRFSDENLERLMRAVSDANLNMLRVWGGGYYETEKFYDACDKHGVLVWQDFCFACGVYPFFDGAFLDTVRFEIADNVKRLRDHPSLALWCGNNEIEAMLGYGMKTLQGDFAVWTEKFFYHILPELVELYDGVTPYIPGSPCGDGFMKGVNSHDEGDVHLWAVWHGLQPLTYYRKKYSRFCSEFGMESIPDMSTVDWFTEGKKCDMSDDVYSAHQKCASGNEKIQFYVSTRFRLPSEFEDLAYLSQIVQSECIRDATEHWRRNRGRCNGAIYWQLNDCWPVLSWSSVDYFERYKALHYAARHFNAPVAVSAFAKGDKVSVCLINDKREPFSGRLSCRLEDFFGKCAFEKEVEAEIGATNSKKICEYDFSNLLKKVKRNAVFVATLLDENGDVVSSATLLFAPEKKLSLPDPKLTFSVEESGENAKITLRAENYARYVKLWLPNVTEPFSDNFFDMTAGESKTVLFPLGDLTAEEIAQKLTVRSAYGMLPRGSAFSDLVLRMRVRLKPLNFVMWLSYILW